MIHILKDWESQITEMSAVCVFERGRDCNLEAQWRQMPKRLKKIPGKILVKRPEVKLREITCKAYGIL